MANVRELRRPLAILAIVLGAVIIAASAVLLSPLADANKRKAESARVQQQLNRVEHEAIPLQNISEKIKTAQQQVNSFYSDRLPQRDSDVAAEVGKLAQASNIRLGEVRYTPPADTDLPNLEKLEIDVSLAGEYPHVVKFINSLERDRLFFIVDRVNLAEQQGGAVRLELHLETYLRRGGASPAT
ncbi:MAG: hypothetical protein JO041_11980 [Acidobacteria bacterium]|nr:hypothetical protein [Acidobacteriota bacterium]